MNKVELIESLKAKHKIESVENALIFVQAVIREVAFENMKCIVSDEFASILRDISVTGINDCVATLDYILNTMREWGIK